MPIETDARLLVRVPGLDPSRIAIARRVLSLGRDPSCDIVLESPYVSHMHARIEVLEDGTFIEDVGALNPVLVNGVRVSAPKRLSHGDEIAIADVEIQYEIGDKAGGRTLRWSPRDRSDGRTTDQLQLSVDESRHCAWVPGGRGEVPLSPLEFRFLHYLYERQGQVCGRDEIGGAVWQAGEFDLDMLYRLVQRVKEKIEPDPSEPRFIASHRGVGYSLNP